MNGQVTALVGTGPGKQEYAKRRLPDAVVADVARGRGIWYSLLHPEHGIVICNIDRIPRAMASIIGMVADRGFPLIVTLRDGKRLTTYLGHRQAEVVFFDGPANEPPKGKEQKDKGERERERERVKRKG